MSTKDIRMALRKRYAPPAWAYLEEVRNKTGYGGGPERTADAIAMSLYPSRGLELHGFEIKVSRSDWVRERDNPDKAEAIARYCDKWWLVTTADIVRLGELPPTWGHMILSDKGLSTAVEAEKRTADNIDKRFIAAMLRRATEWQTTMVHPDDIEERVEQQVQARIATAPDAMTRLQRAHERLLDLVTKFETQTGLPLAHTDFPSLKDAYELVVSEGRRSALRTRMAWEQEWCQRRTEKLAELIAQIDKMET